MMQQKIATIFGGTGFVGRYIVRELARAGYTVKVVTRVPERAYFLKPYGVVGQIVPVAASLKDPTTIDALVRGSDVVVNCIGVLFERRRKDFIHAHVNIPRNIAAACARHNVGRFVHISALSCDKGISRYAKTKHEGEQEIIKACPYATILRPSVIFGPEDQFFNMFAMLMQFLPVLPLIGGGKTKFQPVYVSDVATAAISAITLPDIGDQSPKGKIYELGGPGIFSFRDIYLMLGKWTGRKRLLLPVPFALASLKAFFMQMIPPRPLLTPDQVKSLKTDNIVSETALKIEDLGLYPTGVERIVPAYLERFRSGGRFSDIKTA